MSFIKTVVNIRCFTGLLLITLVFTSCKPQKTSDQLPDIENFKGEIDGKEVSLYHLSSKNGIEVALTNYGARIVSLLAPDGEGIKHDVILGFDKAEDYHNEEEPYYGAIVGPYANRIANGKFELDGETYNLEQNDGTNTLHGGFKGLQFIAWDTKSVSPQSVQFECQLKDGQSGFPGNRTITVTYSLTEDNELTVEYKATTDKKTVINLSNHAYFNLNGEGSGTILNHKLQIVAQQITPVDATLIPTGDLMEVAGTPFDFTHMKRIGADINEPHEQLERGRGYDHNFVLEDWNKNNPHPTKAVKLKGDHTGIVMEIYTDQPGIQFYSGNFMSEKVTLKSGVKDSYRTALALEPQHFPDSPNHPSFPSTTLKPQDTWQSISIYKFTAQQ